MTGELGNTKSLLDAFFAIPQPSVHEIHHRNDERINIIRKSKMIQSVVNIAMHNDDNAVLGPALRTIRKWVNLAADKYSKYDAGQIRKELIEFGALRAFKKILTAESTDIDVKLDIYDGLLIIAQWSLWECYYTNALIQCGIIPTLIEMMANEDEKLAHMCCRIIQYMADAVDECIIEYLVRHGCISALRSYEKRLNEELTLSNGLKLADDIQSLTNKLLLEAKKIKFYQRRSMLPSLPKK